MKSSVFGTILLSALACSFAVPLASAGSDDEVLVTSVYSNVKNGYQRAKSADGTFKRETYAISNGGCAPGTVRDQSIESVKFPMIAGVVAENLAKRNYYLARDSKSADLLLVVYWGATTPGGTDGSHGEHVSSMMAAMNASTAASAAAAADTTGASMDGIQPISHTLRDVANEERMGAIMQMQLFERVRDQRNQANANLLGYIDEINSRNDISRFAGAGTAYNDLITDLEEERYYVIIAAYDFRKMTQEHKKQLLWTTRVSIRAQGNRFDRSLAAMVGNASKFFGQDSGRLLREYQRVPRVDLGELKYLGTVPTPTIKD